MFKSVVVGLALCQAALATDIDNYIPPYQREYPKYKCGRDGGECIEITAEEFQSLIRRATLTGEFAALKKHAKSCNKSDKEIEL